MTKNQVNYLLVLATLVVVWLYLNTFSMMAMVQKRNAAPARTIAPTMAGGEAPGFSRAAGDKDRRALMEYLAEIKKRSEARTPASANVVKPAETKAPVPAVPEKKQ
jgi:hypothetical protein